CYLGALHQRSLGLVRTMLAARESRRLTRLQVVGYRIRSFIKGMWKPKGQEALLQLFPELLFQLVQRKRVVEYAVRTFLYGVPPELLTREAAGFEAEAEAAAEEREDGEAQAPRYSYPGEMLGDVLDLHDASVNDVFAFLAGDVAG